MSGLCAICVDDTRPVTMQPLGRGNALVAVCSACNDETPRATCGPIADRDYPPPRTGPGVTSTLRQFANAANKLTGQQDPLRHRHESMRRATPGFVLVRVARRSSTAASVDRNEALASLRGQPWFSELRHLGSDSKWHLFERPDTEARTAERRAKAGDVMSIMEQYRVGGDGKAVLR